MKELSFTSIMLFFGIITMVIIFFVKYLETPRASENPSSVVQENSAYEKGSIIDSICIVLSSYAFVINFYPIYSSMERRTNRNGMYATTMAMIFCFIIYISFSLLAIH
jgi:amino acid permease